MVWRRSTLAFTGMLFMLLIGCAPRNPNTTITRPVTNGSDRKQITLDNQAAMSTLRADRQAVTRPTSGIAATRSADAIISSLKVAVAKLNPSKEATTRPSENNVSGSVTFTQVGTMLIMVADLTGLQPNSSHALEIHELGDLSAPDLGSIGEIWQIAPNQSPMAGALGNVEADAAGCAYFERTVGDASVVGSNSVVGHSIVVRALPSQPADTEIMSNARLAGGIIERREQ